MATQQNLTTLIINAHTSIGQATAERYAALGTNIILYSSWNESQAGQLISNIRAMGSKVTFLHAEAVKKMDFEKLFSQISKLQSPGVIAIHDIAKTFDLQMLRRLAMLSGASFRLIYMVEIGTQSDLETVSGWMQTLALENAPRNATINAVIIPAGEQGLFSTRTGPGDVADAAEFFGFDLGNLITGQYLLLNATPKTLITQSQPVYYENID